VEDGFLHKVYDFVNHIIHLDDLKLFSEVEKVHPSGKHCPVTGLNISMQPNNSKFLSYTGVKWYYEHDYKTFKKVLAPRIHKHWLNKEIDLQFREIAHDIRNADSNPRNNTKRKIRRILDDNNSLFNNMELIDKKKLKEAGYIQ
jgi:hypothetical protein